MRVVRKLSFDIQRGALYSAGARFSVGEIAWHDLDPSIVRQPHYSEHTSTVRVWSLSKPFIVRVLASHPLSAGHTHQFPTHTAYKHTYSSTPTA